MTTRTRIYYAKNVPPAVMLAMDAESLLEISQATLVLRLEHILRQHAGDTYSWRLARVEALTYTVDWIVPQWVTARLLRSF